MTRAARFLGGKRPTGGLPAAFLVALTLLLASPAPGQEEEEPVFGIAYTTDIDAEVEPRIRELIEESIALLTDAARPPDSEAALRRRLRDDVARIARILRSEGFYDHEIRTEVDESARPVRIRIEIEPGPVFLLADYDIAYLDPVPDDAPRDADALGLELGERARATALQAAERRLLLWLNQNGRPFARLADTRYLADMDQAVLRAEITVDPGAEATFGPLAILGVESVREDYLHRILEWEEGRPYDRRETERLRQRLAATELFDQVLVETPETLDERDELPVTVEVAERAHRTIGAGLSYSTDEDGPGAEVFWEHRNLFSEGERLRLEAGGTRPRQRFSANFRKPNYLRIDQSLLLENELRHERSEAFDELTSQHFLGLERPLTDRWTARAGPAFMLTQIKEDGRDRQRFGLLGVTGGLVFDGRDDLLNPTSGARLSATVTPWYSVVGDSARFLSTEATGAIYLAPFEGDRLVLAARGRLGTLSGSSRSEIPANLRFYAGGGGSIRGYGFRSVGPLDGDDEPIGGRSVVEIGLEARLRVTDTIGIVPFLDLGQVYDTPWPTGNEKLRAGAGLGLRYFTGFGPLRLDVAVPLHRRRGVDRSFQFYVSIGQSF